MSLDFDWKELHVARSHLSEHGGNTLADNRSLPRSREFNVEWLTGPEDGDTQLVAHLHRAPLHELPDVVHFLSRGGGGFRQIPTPWYFDIELQVKETSCHASGSRSFQNWEPT